MGFSFPPEAARDISFEVRSVVTECTVVRREFIFVLNGKLTFMRDGRPEVQVRTSFFGGKVHVGCHTLTREAWELLRDTVEAKLK